MQRIPWRPLPALLLVTALTVLSPARRSMAASGPFPDSLAGHRLSGSLNMYYSYPIPDEATAVTLADTHSILVSNAYLIHGYGAEIHALNPSLLIFQYYDGDYSKETKFPEPWYLHDAAGNRLINEVPMYLMDPLSTEPYTEGGVTYVGWRGWVTKQCQALLAAAPGSWAPCSTTSTPTASGSYPYYYYYYHYQYRAPEDAASNGHRTRLPWRGRRKAQTNGQAESATLSRSGQT